MQIAGKQVVVIEDVPRFKFDPFSRVRTAQIPARQVLARWLGSQDAADPGVADPTDKATVEMVNVLLKHITDSLSDVRLVDLTPELCEGYLSECTYRRGSQMLYFDRHHLSPEGAQYALRDFRLPALSFNPSSIY